MEENKENIKAEKKKNKKDIEIENLKAELETKNDLLLRTAAEFDNFKKRTEREKLTVAEFATLLGVSPSSDPAVDARILAEYEKNLKQK